jgi:hypothetical protein
MRKAFPGIADAAVHLDGGLAHRSRGARAVDLRHSGGADRLGRRQLVNRPGGMSQHTDRTLDQRQAFREQVRDGLIRADRIAVLLADFRVLASQVVCTSGGSDQVRRRGGQGKRQPPFGVV